MHPNHRTPTVYWHSPLTLWLSFATAFTALAWVFATGLENLWFNWHHKEEYSHGILLPFISLFLIWQKKHDIAAEPFVGSWAGLGLFVLGTLGCFAGAMSTLFPVMQYSLLISLGGLTLAITGWRAFRFFIVPLLILLLSVPLPNFIYKNLSFELQLLSSSIGVHFIRLFNIPVYLEGNVIDLGTMKLQVVEACSGLRYLFPLMTLGFIAAHFFKVPLWKKILVFLSTIPITVLMNSLRIGIIGVTVEWWGQAMAEGFLHDFEGWVVFMGCTAILFAEMALIARLSTPRAHLIDLLMIELPTDRVKQAVAEQNRTLPLSYVIACALALVVSAVAYFTPEAGLKTISRAPFSSFELELGHWSGVRAPIEQRYIDELKFDDYLSVDYKNNHQDAINLYVAFYNSQSAGQSAHSPRSCIPAGGWEIQNAATINLPNVKSPGVDLEINRLQVKKGDTRLMVYYFFNQRHRHLTNEFLVKWYLMWDAITLHRKDGALVRISFVTDRNTTLEQADQRAIDFLTLAYPKLNRHIPD
ncbi:MAG TPA: VPLPA-CTERM-specific exosortase XrtD [Marinagarivorans sp.]|nr:VPLPA-CTERM-specific exosortase XrtD [Marinagarivorans sp.]